MPGFNAKQLAYQARNSNMCVLMIGDQQIAFAQTVTHSFDLGAEALFGVGSAKPQEIQQLRVQPTITLDNFALSANGEDTIQGGVALASLLANNQFNMFILDGQTNLALFTYVGCVAGSFNESMPTNQPITDAVTFLALDVLGEDGQSLLDGPNAYDVPNLQGSPVLGGLGVQIGGSVTVGGVSIGGTFGL